ncbi:MAG: hypothetical protein ACI9AR_000009 [Flavobacteriaceae bacterium]|jgi:hypothetical protein
MKEKLDIYKQKIKKFFSGRFWYRRSVLVLALFLFGYILIYNAPTEAAYIDTITLSGESLSVFSHAMSGGDPRFSYVMSYPQVRTENRDIRERHINRHIHDYIQDILSEEKNKEDISSLTIESTFFHTTTTLSIVFIVNDEVKVLSLYYPSQPFNDMDEYILGSLTSPDKQILSNALREVLLTNERTDEEKQSIIQATMGENLDDIVFTEGGVLVLFEKEDLYKGQDSLMQILIPLEF